MNTRKKFDGKKLVAIVAGVLVGLLVVSLCASLFGGFGGGSSGGGTIITPGEKLPYVSSLTYSMRDIVESDGIASTNFTGFIQVGNDVTDTFYFPKTGNEEWVDMTVNVNVAGIYKVSGTIAKSATREIKYVRLQNKSESGLPSAWKNIVGKGRIAEDVGMYASNCVVSSDAEKVDLCYQYLKAGPNTLRLSVQSLDAALGISSLTFDLCGKDSNTYQNATTTFCFYKNPSSYVGSYILQPEGMILRSYGDVSSVTFKDALTITEGGTYRINLLFSQVRQSFTAADLEKVKFTFEYEGETTTKTLAEVMNIQLPADKTDPLPDLTNGCSLSCVYVDLGKIDLLQGTYTITYENPLDNSNNLWSALSLIELVKQ